MAVSALFLFASPNLAAAQSCPGLFSKIKSGISALVGKSPEHLQIEIASIQQKLDQATQDYTDLNNYMRGMGLRSAAGKAARVARGHLSKKLKEIYQLQKKRYGLEKKYFTTPMNEKFIGEVVGVEWTNQFREMGVRIQYLDPSVRNAFRVQFNRSGQLLNSQGHLLNEKLLFVMDQKGNIYAAPPGLQLSNGKFIRHSSFLAGEPVAAAGEMIVSNGKVVLVNRRSGHYKPSQKANNQFLSRLQELGVDISDIKIGPGF
jgi:hypothetical protein